MVNCENKDNSLAESQQSVPTSIAVEENLLLEKLTPPESDFLEQHFLRETRQYTELLNVLSLEGRKVVELGTGDGALTNLILEQDPSKVVSYEIDPGIIPESLHETTDIIIGDFTEQDFSYLEDGNYALISAPPYSTLPYIREHLIDRYDIKDVVLMIPNKAREMFSDFEVAFALDGSAFEPVSSGPHLVIYKGFGEQATQLGVVERDIRSVLAQYAELDPEDLWREQDILDVLTDHVKSNIEASIQHTKRGKNRRFVIILSENEQKLDEARRNFDNYGIDVALAPHIEHPEYLRRIFSLADESNKILCVMREYSNLYIKDTKTLSIKRDLDLVDNLSQLVVYKFDDNKDIIAKTYEHRTEGIIDLSKISPSDPTVFGWDDRFVLPARNQTYNELKKQGFKVSSRDMTISKYINDSVHYKKAVSWNYTSYPEGRPVDFEVSPQKILENNPLINNTSARELGFWNLAQQASNEGIFYRSALNRRQKTYWLPGLNGGLPLVPKKDAIHETTFGMHDLCHLLISDPVYTGVSSPEIAQVRNSYRMMSEAVTLVLADMLFVDTLNREGHEYDFGKRKIYPLFKSLDLSLDGDDHIENIKTILHANMRYVLRGDDSEYRELIKDGEGEKALNDFKEKYAPFFIEDYKWTAESFKNMEMRGEEFKNWWRAVEPIRDKMFSELITCEELLGRCSQRGGDMVEAVFEEVFENRIKPYLQGETIKPESSDYQRAQAFGRYMMGQMEIFSRYPDIPGAQGHEQRLRTFILDHSEGISIEEVGRARKYYDAFVETLCNGNVISQDDATTYKEVFPLFSPFYAYYDESKKFYQSLSSIAEEVAGPDTYTK